MTDSHLNLPERIHELPGGDSNDAVRYRMRSSPVPMYEGQVISEEYYNSIAFGGMDSYEEYKNRTDGLINSMVKSDTELGELLKKTWNP